MSRGRPGSGEARWLSITTHAGQLRRLEELLADRLRQRHVLMTVELCKALVEGVLRPGIQQAAGPAVAGVIIALLSPGHALAMVAARLQRDEIEHPLEVARPPESTAPAA